MIDKNFELYITDILNKTKPEELYTKMMNHPATREQILYYQELNKIKKSNISNKKTLELEKRKRIMEKQKQKNSKPITKPN